MPTCNVHADIQHRVESYTIHMILAHRLRIISKSHNFLFGINIILLHSLHGHSSPVRVSTLLFLFLLCCISSLGQRGLLHNQSRLLGVALASRGNSVSPPRTSNKKLQGQSAVSTRHPTLQHPLEKHVSSSQELHPMRNFLLMHLQEPDFFWFTSDTFHKRPLSSKY